MSGPPLDMARRVGHLERVLKMFRAPRRRQNGAWCDLAIGDDGDDHGTAPDTKGARRPTRCRGPAPVAAASARAGLPLLEWIGRGGVYCLWYLAFYVLCLLRPFTGLMVVAAIVMLPMALVVYAHPDAARGMPFWSFGLMAIGLVAFALAYALFLDWFTPPGAVDPFEMFRKRW